MPPPPQAYPQGAEPSVWQKMKMGATMGSLVGLTIGFIFGTFAILRNGAGPNGFFRSLSTYMLSSAATFGFFLSIGSVIRTDGLTMREWAEEQIRLGKVPAVGMAQGIAYNQSTALRQGVWDRRKIAAASPFDQRIASDDK